MLTVASWMMLQKLFIDQGGARRNAATQVNFWRTVMRRLIHARCRNSTRSVANELHENANAIEAWRATLPERQRKRLLHPLSNVRRWRAATVQGNGKRPEDLKREAAAAWRRFVSCVRLLLPDQAAPLRRAVHDESGAMAHHVPETAPAGQKRYTISRTDACLLNAYPE
jgi:hypothetical protein